MMAEDNLSEEMILEQRAEFKRRPARGSANLSFHFHSRNSRPSP